MSQKQQIGGTPSAQLPAKCLQLTPGGDSDLWRPIGAKATGTPASFADQHSSSIGPDMLAFGFFLGGQLFWDL